MFQTFDRYQRVYHRSTRWYLNVVAPGSDLTNIMVADKHNAFVVPRASLRPLRWYERLLNR